MLKLYKRIKQVLHYHEAWADGARITEHWGKVGERGEAAARRRNKKLSEEKDLKRVLSKPLAEGFEPIDIDDHATLMIEYAIEGMGNTDDLDKRHALEDRMNETLGWTGLGHCDGGSIGSGTMEVYCFVVDFKTAKRVVEKDLKKTRFADYSRIYDQEADPPPASTKLAQGPGMFMPPWLMFPGVGQEDRSWQSGKPAAYLGKWLAWYQSVPAEALTAYAVAFREPKGWSGFYAKVATWAKP
jgi:hypothetical protein